VVAAAIENSILPETAPTHPIAGHPYPIIHPSFSYLLPGHSHPLITITNMITTMDVQMVFTLWLMIFIWASPLSYSSSSSDAVDGLSEERQGQPPTINTMLAMEILTPIVGLVRLIFYKFTSVKFECTKN
jgi:hypothetical protein